MNRTASEMTDNTTAIPEELKRSVPRPWKLTAQGKGVFAGAILMVIAAVAFTVGAYVSVRHTAAIHRAMQEHGRTQSAAIVKTYRAGDEDKRDVFVYEFSVDDKTYRGRSEIAIKQSPRYQAGSSISVRYLPERPAVNWIDGYPPRGIPLFVIPLLAGVMLVCAFAMLRRLWRQEELVAEGRAAAAMVKTVKRVHRGENRKQRAQIQFLLMSGARQEAQLEFGKNAPQPDSTIIILYDRDNPRRVLRYPACLVRVEKPGEW